MRARGNTACPKTMCFGIVRSPENAKFGLVKVLTLID